jgi:hypothetical protein
VNYLADQVKSISFIPSQFPLSVPPAIHPTSNVFAISFLQSLSVCCLESDELGTIASKGFVF